MEAGKDIWAVIERSDDGIKPVSLEALSAAKSLAVKTGGKVVAAWLGSGQLRDADLLSRHGADRIKVYRHENLARYSSAGYLAALMPAISIANPRAVILPATTHGKELAPALASQIGSGLATDCISIDWQDGIGLTIRRPVYAGKAISTVKFTGNLTHVLTLRPNIFRDSVEAPAGTAHVDYLDAVIPESPLLLKIKEIVKDTGSQMDIAEARIIVSGGLGMQGPENFTLLEELANVLGGAVGASRPVVDNQWRNYSSQVGQTGRTVAPDLYIACGISGAVQHLAGMSSSKCIVAINKDRSAPIFSVADYGIVGDALEIIPLLTGEFKKALG